MKKGKMMIAGAVAAASLLGLGGASIASAATSGHDGLIDKIATKFNLKKEDVKALFEEDRAARDAERTAEVETQLAKLVTDGKITAEQKDKLTSKRKELEAQREADRASMDGKTDEERKAAMEVKRTEIDKWASDNGIDKQYLRYLMGGGRGGHGGHGGPQS